MNRLPFLLATALTWTTLTAATRASEPVAVPGGNGPACEGFGPQTPRDIDNKEGQNQSVFPLAPRYQDLNLCNLHFHNQAEHKAQDFAVAAGPGDHGGGFKCAMGETLTAAERALPAGEVCGGLKPGDTIEVHWVHTSCDVAPGKGLGACVSSACPSYTEQTCSQYQVTWSVRPRCAKLDIASLGRWCEKNAFDEDHAHGVRPLVTNPKLLAPIGE